MDVITEFFTSTYRQIISDCRDDPEAMTVMRRTLRPALIMVATLAAGISIYGVGQLFVR